MMTAFYSWYIMDKNLDPLICTNCTDLSLLKLQHAYNDDGLFDDLSSLVADSTIPKVDYLKKTAIDIQNIVCVI